MNITTSSASAVIAPTITPVAYESGNTDPWGNRPRTEEELLKIPTLRIGSRYHSHRETVAIPSALKRLRLNEKPAGGENGRMFRIATADAGDERITWDARFPEEIREAKQMFNDLVAKGMVPYRCDPKGKRTAEVMRRFDPNAEEVLFLPVQVPGAVAGG